MLAKIDIFCFERYVVYQNESQWVMSERAINEMQKASMAILVEYAISCTHQSFAQLKQASKGCVHWRKLRNGTREAKRKVRNGILLFRRSGSKQYVHGKRSIEANSYLEYNPYAGEKSCNWPCHCEDDDPCLCAFAKRSREKWKCVCERSPLLQKHPNGAMWHCRRSIPKIPLLWRDDTVLGKVCRSVIGILASGYASKLNRSKECQTEQKPNKNYSARKARTYTWYHKEDCQPFWSVVLL